MDFLRNQGFLQHLIYQIQKLFSGNLLIICMISWNVLTIITFQGLLVKNYPSRHMLWTIMSCTTWKMLFLMRW